MDSITHMYVEDALLEAKDTVDEYFEYLSKFPKQGLALSYLSQIGQRIDCVLHFISAPQENNNDNDPNQLCLDFDSPTSTERNVANAGQPQLRPVFRLA